MIRCDFCDLSMFAMLGLEINFELLNHPYAAIIVLL